MNRPPDGRVVRGRHDGPVTDTHRKAGPALVLAALGVAGFQQNDLGFVGKNGAAAGCYDRMVINDQNAHGLDP